MLLRYMIDISFSGMSVDKFRHTDIKHISVCMNHSVNLYNFIIFCVGEMWHFKAVS